MIVPGEDTADFLNVERCDAAKLAAVMLSCPSDLCDSLCALRVYQPHATFNAEDTEIAAQNAEAEICLYCYTDSEFATLRKRLS